MTQEKLKKDRKILKKIDAPLIHQSFGVYFCHLLLYSLVLVSSNIMAQAPKWVFAIGFSIVIFTILRIFLILKIEVMYAKGPQRCRYIVNVLGACQSLLWGAFVCILTFKISDSAITWGLLTTSAALSLYYAHIWVPYYQTNKLFASLHLLPLAFASTLIGSELSIIMSLGFVVTLMMLLRWIRRAHQQYWEQQTIIADLKEANRKLEIAELKLSRIGEIPVNMVTDLSYEVRAPMSSLLGMLNLLSEMQLTDNQKEIITVAHHAGQHMLNLMDDIMDFSKIASGAIVLESTVFNLRKCFDETLETIGPQAHAKGLELTCCYDQDLPVRVFGDRSRLIQVMSNLIHNSIKYSDQGEIIVAVHMVRLSSSEGLLRVQVSDQGTGISAEAQDQLFRAFHKADSATSRKNGGTGLGLAICKGLVEAMQGQIGLVSEEGRGSTFWFTVNLKISSQQGQAKNQAAVFKGKRILLFGMPEGMANSIVRLLDSWSMESLIIAGDYNEAIKCLRNAARHDKAYDCCLINFGFQYQGALKLSKIIQEDPSIANCKQVILLSLEQRGQHNPQQNSVIMTKPVQSKALHKAFETFFKFNRKQAALSYLPQKLMRDQKNYRILLIEDNKVNQMIEKGMLHRLGYSVSIAKGGEEALGVINDSNVDLILLDCHLSEMDAFETAMRIRELEIAKSIKTTPIIAMATHSVEGEESRCYAAGMDDCLLKPIDYAELKAKLRRWLLIDDLEVINES